MYSEILAGLKAGTQVRADLIRLKEELKADETTDAIKEELDYSPELFIRLLSDEDAKARKHAATVMGMLGEPVFCDALMEAYRNETTMFVRPAHLKALSLFDFSPFEEELLNRKKILETGGFDPKDVKHIAEELSILKDMFPERMKSHVYKDPSEPLNIIFTIGKELTGIMLDEIDLVEKNSHTATMQLGITTKTKKISEMAQIRLYKDLFFPLNGLKAAEKNKLAESLLKGDLFPILKMTHESDEGAFRFRLTSQRFDVSKSARELEALSKGRLVNAPSDYEIEIRLIENKEGKLIPLLKLHTRKDRRFSYRKQVVAASMNPANAAAVVRLAKDYLIDEAQILDPFCGTGALLIERDKLLHAEHIYGIDSYAPAIEGARVNAAAADVRIHSINRNFFDFKHEYPFDEIITDMPRLEKEFADELYARFFTKSLEILKKDGLIIMYSNEKGLVKKHLRLQPGFKLLREFSFYEKEGYSVFIIAKLLGE